MDYKTIMAEFEAGCKFKEVNKRGNMWEARIRDPKLKIEVYLGYYSTPEEAALVVKKKKAEFEDTSLNKFQGRKLPSGVTRETESEEAVVVADRKTAELQEVYEGKPRGNSECEDDDEVLLECESEVTGNFDKLDCEFVHGSRASNIEPGTSNSACIGDKRVIDQMSRRKTACSLDEKFNSKKKAKVYSESEPTGAEKALDTTACYYSPTSVLDTANSSHSPVNDKPDDTMVDVPFNLNVEPGNESSFDEAVRLVTINEYGQLLGEFSVLDESMWFEM